MLADEGSYMQFQYSLEFKTSSFSPGCTTCENGDLGQFLTTGDGPGYCDSNGGFYCWNYRPSARSAQRIEVGTLCRADTAAVSPFDVSYPTPCWPHMRSL